MMRFHTGFAKAMYNTIWTPTPTQKLSGKGKFKMKIDDLISGKTYQYRAFVKHPKLTVWGDNKRIEVK